MIALIDYGLGNIQAFANIYKRLDIPVTVAKDARALAQADKLILPGVGAYDWAMQRFNASGMREAVDDLVLRQGMPVLGVCVGMQIMGRRSDEGQEPGLGWIDADVLKIHAAAAGRPLDLPHMGWNDVSPASTDCLFRGIAAPRYYFLHSYHVVPADPAATLATSTYGVAIAAAIRRGHIYGTQFHPEKSHQWGVRLLENFAKL